jgi:hypothetical protein
MKIMAVVFIYPQNLSEKQENILIINLKKIKEKAIDEMKKASKSFIVNEVVKTKMEVMANIAVAMIKLEKESDKRYRFEYPDEDLTGMSFDGRFKFKAGRMIPKKALINFITNGVARDMGFKPGSVKWEEIEMQDV